MQERASFYAPRLAAHPGRGVFNHKHSFERALQMLSSSGAGGLVTVQLMQEGCLFFAPRLAAHPGRGGRKRSSRMAGEA